MNKEEFIRTCRGYIRRNGLVAMGDSVVVALSGGADSVCLAHVLSELADELGLELTAVHVHHGIRGDEADRDEMFARSVATSLGMTYICERCEVPVYANSNHLTLEEAARVLRYEALQRVADERGADRIAVAHHLDDQAETVLMNILRGTGPEGLSGMSAVRGRYIRPLLAVSKSDILDYLEEIGQGYVIDSTNESLEHTRNRVRLELLPLARELYPGADKHIASLAEDMGLWRSEVASSVEKCKDTVIEDGKIVISEYLKKDHSTRHAIIRLVVEKYIPGMKDVSRVHYLQIDALAASDDLGEKTVTLPQGIVVRRQYGYLVVQESDEKSEIYTELQIPGSTMVTLKNKNIEVSTKIVEDFEFENIFQEKDYTKHIKYDRIENGLVVRNPLEGDYIVLDSTETRKKLSRYYIDRKIPKSERSSQLVVADGSHVVWALPDRLSYSYRVTGDSDKVLEICVKETEQS